MTPLQNILAAYRSSSQTEREKGAYFEELVRTYLRYEASYADPSGWLKRLRDEVERLSRKHERLGYRKLTRMLREGGWQVGKKQVQKIRRE